MNKIVFFLVAFAAQAAMAGIFYTVDDDGAVTRHEGDVPFPAGAIWQARCPRDADPATLSVVNGVVVVDPVKVNSAQAKLEASFFEALVPMATVYRIVMERNFGTGACTNRTVTETYVTTYFSTKLALGTITSLESSDSLFLLANTPKIMEFTGDGTIWSFPWSQVPEPEQ